jgi:Na+/proline symporter
MISKSFHRPKNKTEYGGKPMSVQLLIILIYFAMTIAIGLYAQKKSKTACSFHGAGLGIVMCVAAGTGEWLGGTSTTGVSESSSLPFFLPSSTAVWKP